MRSIAVLALGAVLLTGCGKKAEGQVAAVVNGEEITVQEVNAEMGVVPASHGAQKGDASKQALQRIIERRLLAQAAKDDDLDKSPEYLIRQRALDDALLVQLLAKKVGATIKIPDTREIESFIASRPEQFANRSILSIDRIQFVPTGDSSLPARLEKTETMDEIAAVLKSSGIAFERGPTGLDSAQLGSSLAKQILALPAGKPFILPGPGVYVAGVVTSVRVVPVAGDRAKPVAVGILRNEQLSKTVQRRLDAAKAQAKIEYQAGFAPPKPVTQDSSDKGSN